MSGYGNFYKPGVEQGWPRTGGYDGSYIPQYHPQQLSHPQVFSQVLPQAHHQMHPHVHQQVHPQAHHQLHQQVHPQVHHQLHQQPVHHPSQLHPQPHAPLPTQSQQQPQQQPQQQQQPPQPQQPPSQGQIPNQSAPQPQNPPQPAQSSPSSQSQPQPQPQDPSSQSQSQPPSQPQSSSNPETETEGEFDEQDDENEEIAVKLLVPNNMVGSIIGKGGVTIKDITAQTTAKIHIAQGDEMSPERMVTITGSAASTGQAQFQICVKMQEEAYAELSVESDVPLEQRMALLPLKLLVPNGVVGRLIGKGGVNLKKTMAETNTFITCSKEDEFTRFTGDRIVSVIGSVEDQYKAQVAVTHQVRQFAHSQVQAQAAAQQGQAQAQPQGQAQPSSSPPASGNPEKATSPVSHEGSAAPAPRANQRSENYSYQYPRQPAHSPSTYAQTGRLPFRIAPELQEHEETICVQVPNGVVGSIIGKGGATVREMGSRSRCQIRVARNDEVDANAANRPITLTGTIDSLFKAQAMIFNKIVEAPPAVGGGADHLLRVELTVPNDMVGRVIGKKGAQVRKIIEMSGARVTINQEEDDDSIGTVVSILGTLDSNLIAQYRIHEILFFQNAADA